MDPREAVVWSRRPTAGDDAPGRPSTARSYPSPARLFVGRVETSTPMTRSARTMMRAVASIDRFVWTDAASTAGCSASPSRGGPTTTAARDRVRRYHHNQPRCSRGQEGRGTAPVEQYLVIGDDRPSSADSSPNSLRSSRRCLEMRVIAASPARTVWRGARTQGRGGAHRAIAPRVTPISPS